MIDFVRFVCAFLCREVVDDHGLFRMGRREKTSIKTAPKALHHHGNVVISGVRSSGVVMHAEREAQFLQLRVFPISAGPAPVLHRAERFEDWEGSEGQGQV